MTDTHVWKGTHTPAPTAGPAPHSTGNAPVNEPRREGGQGGGAQPSQGARHQHLVCSQVAQEASYLCPPPPVTDSILRF